MRAGRTCSSTKAAYKLRVFGVSERARLSSSSSRRARTAARKPSRSLVRGVRHHRALSGGLIQGCRATTMAVDIPAAQAGAEDVAEPETLAESLKGDHLLALLESPVGCRWSCTTFPGRAHGRILRTILQIGQALSEQMSLSTVTIDPGALAQSDLHPQKMRMGQ